MYNVWVFIHYIYSSFWSAILGYFDLGIWHYRYHGGPLPDLFLLSRYYFCHRFCNRLWNSDDLLNGCWLCWLLRLEKVEMYLLLSLKLRRSCCWDASGICGIIFYSHISFANTFYIYKLNTFCIQIILSLSFRLFLIATPQPLHHITFTKHINKWYENNLTI